MEFGFEPRADLRKCFRLIFVSNLYSWNDFWILQTSRNLIGVNLDHKENDLAVLSSIMVKKDDTHTCSFLNLLHQIFYDERVSISNIGLKSAISFGLFRVFSKGKNCNNTLLSKIEHIPLADFGGYLIHYRKRLFSFRNIGAPLRTISTIQ